MTNVSGACGADVAARQLKDMYEIVAGNLQISNGEAKQLVQATLGSSDENNFIADNLKTDSILGATEDMYMSSMQDSKGVDLSQDQTVQKTQETQGGGIGEFLGNLLKGFQQSDSNQVGASQDSMNFSNGMVSAPNGMNGSHSQDNGMMQGGKQDPDSYVNLLMSETGMNEEEAIAELTAMFGKPMEE